MVEGYPHGLGGWGVGAVFKEGGRLQVKYFRLLAPFIFAFVLPTALIQLLEVFGVSWWVADQSPFLPPGPHPPTVFGVAWWVAGQSPFLPPGPHTHTVFGVAWRVVRQSPLLPPGPHPHTVFAPPPSPSTPSWSDYLIVLAVSLVLWLLGSLAVASICKVVRYIYSDHEEDPSVISSIFKSLPEVVFRLLVTALWVFLLTILTVFTVSLPFGLLGLLFKHTHILPYLQGLFVTVAVAVLAFLFLLSQEVAVLEPENYGLAALKRSAKLVEEKLLAALVLFFFSALVGGLFSSGFSWLARTLATGKLPAWTVYVLAVVFALLYLLFIVYLLLVTVVLYFSSKVKYGGEERSLPVDNQYNVLAAEE